MIRLRFYATVVVYLLLAALVILFLHTTISATNGFKKEVRKSHTTFPKRDRTTNAIFSGPWAHAAVNKTKLESFKIVQPFVFPQPAFSRPPKIILNSRWVTELQYFLSSLDTNSLSLVTSSVEHREVLLNWLIAAYVKVSPPLRNILVLSMDDKLHNTLVTRGIPSLYIHKDMIVRPSADVPRVFSQVHVTRMVLWRLINHYGYDVINYDCDAIPLKNLQPIFDENKEIDLIGTFGKGPDGLYKKWGVTLNTGVMVLRATKNMEYFWQEVPHGRDPPITDDQNSINFCLDHMRIMWTNYNKKEKIEQRSKNIFGKVAISSESGGKYKFLRVMLMPYTTVCRHVCDPKKRDEYFVWHALAIRSNRTVAKKKSQASVGNAWHLVDNWKELSDLKPQLQGVEWLKSISH